MQSASNKWQLISGEISGSLGDLGVLLPFLIGFVSIAGFDSTSILFGFGLMYILTGIIYQAPVPVQPMKVVGAAVLVGQINASEAAASGLIMGAVLLFLALSGLIERLVGVIPKEVNMGIVVGLGLSLGVLGIRYASSEIWLGLLAVFMTLLLFSNNKLPAALLVLLGGTLLGLMAHPPAEWPLLHPGIYLPALTWPDPATFERGFLIGFLPQFPQSIANAVIVSASLAMQLFPERAERITERNLLITMGAGNLLVPLIGGFPWCHGSGGMAAHYRFGGRTMATPLIIGTLLLITGTLLGPGAVSIMALIPQAILGCLLLFGGLELLLSARTALVASKSSFFCISGTAIMCLAFNVGAGFIAGLALSYLLKKTNPFGEENQQSGGINQGY